MSGNAPGYAALARLAAQLRGMSDITAEIAREARPLVEEACRARAAQGLDPDGNPWAPRKDGSPALQGIADKISCTVIGNGILQVTLSGGAVWHHRASGTKTMPSRRVIPDAGNDMPDYVVQAVMTAAERVWKRRTRA